MKNLDYKCIEKGQEIGADGNKNILQKALGILQEDGVYAMFLWLEDKDESKKVRKSLTEMVNTPEIKNYLLSESNNFHEGNFKDFCKILGDVASDIDKLLFMKKLLERTLIYALYHAKVK